MRSLCLLNSQTAIAVRTSDLHLEPSQHSYHLKLKPCRNKPLISIPGTALSLSLSLFIWVALFRFLVAELVVGFTKDSVIFRLGFGWLGFGLWFQRYFGTGFLCLPWIGACDIQFRTLNWKLITLISIFLWVMVILGILSWISWMYLLGFMIWCIWNEPTVVSTFIS